MKHEEHVMNILKKIITILLVMIMACSILVFVPRQVVVNCLMVNNVNQQSDHRLLAILGGGMINANMGKSTKERLDRCFTYLKTNRPKYILVCEYEKHTAILYNYLVSKGINSKYFVKPSFHYSVNNSGTLNNVLEILDFMDKNNIVEVAVITSPYHEKRVNALFESLSNRQNVHRKISFIHVNDSEIISAPFKRYVQIIAHEIGAMMIFKISNAIDDITNVWKEI